MEVVILCGGKGTRSYPFTEYFPKPMMPIAGTPMLVHLMNFYAQQGVRHFVLAAGHRIEVLVDYFAGRFNEWKIDIVDTGPESETGERVRRCRDYVGDTFYATYGDGLGDIHLGRLLKFHRASGGLATLTSVPLRSQYGTVVHDDHGHVKKFVEKPVVRDHWINAGFFVFEKKVFDVWEGQSLEQEVFPNLVSSGQVYTYRHEGFWKSMDTSKDQAELERLYLNGEATWTLDLDDDEDALTRLLPQIVRNA